MTSPRFARLKSIVLAANALPRDERSAYLDQACGDDAELRAEAESLLAHETEPPDLVRTGALGNLPPAETWTDSDPSSSMPPHPERIGPYRILHVLGEGGMGIVYRARQTEPVRRDVALKLVRGVHGGRVLARFQAERQALALMDHPNIAKMLDAGSDEEGHPYFVMELVEEQVPLREYCETRDLSVERRVDLIRDVARAVHHAHQRGVIHRDLKSSNVLVTDRDGVPVPKVIDFGIAKAIEEPSPDVSLLTREGQVIGTLRSMSPEQARGAIAEIGTPTDVYSLGVLFYEVLTGAAPYETDASSVLATVRTICETPPRPFRETAPPGRRIDADLETIVRKALEKEPARRYPSLAALAEDLDRQRASLPILARPPSAAYQLRKLVARNPVASTLVGGIALLVLGFGVWMSVLYSRSEANLRRALQAESEASQVSDFMVDLFDVSHPSAARGTEVTARELLDRGAERVERELGGQPAVQARMMRAMGVTYRGLGLYGKADTLLTAARQRAAELSGEGNREEARILTDLGALQEIQGHFDAAESSFARALAIHEARPDADPSLAAVARASLGWVLAQEGRAEEAEPLLAHAMSTLERTPGPNPRDLPAVINSYAHVLRARGRYAEAEAAFRRALSLRTEILPADHPELAESLSSLASLLWLLGRLDEADPLTRQALEIKRRIYGTNHPEYAVDLMNFAGLTAQRGNAEEAERSLVQALAIFEGSFGALHPDVVIALNNLGVFYREQGRLEDGRAVLERSLEIQIALSGPQHPSVATLLNNLGELHVTAGRAAIADSLFRRSAAIREATYGADAAQTALPLHNLGRLRLAEGNLTEADSLLTRALDIRERTLGPAHERIVESLTACAELRRRQGRAAEAATLEARADSLRTSST